MTPRTILFQTAFSGRCGRTRDSSAQLPAARDRLDINVDYGEVSQVARDHVALSNTDLAVIRTHGRSALTAAVLGSMARALLGRLDCDVLLVGQQAEVDGISG